MKHDETDEASSNLTVSSFNYSIMGYTNRFNQVIGGKLEAHDNAFKSIYSRDVCSTRTLTLTA